MIESPVWSIWREFSTAADDLDAYGEAFGITLVSWPERFRVDHVGLWDGPAPDDYVGKLSY